MSGEQIRRQVPPKLFGVNSWRITSQCRLSFLCDCCWIAQIRRQKMHGSRKCCGELAQLRVDDIWQITDAGDQELRRLVHSSRQGTM